MGIQTSASILDSSFRGNDIFIVLCELEAHGGSPEDIIVVLPHLNLSQVHEALKKTHPSILEKKIGRIKDLY